VDQLIESLQNFELVVDNKTEKKGKRVAFAANTGDEEAHRDIVDDENLSENLVLLGRQFNRILKQVNKRSRGNGQNIRFNIDKQQNGTEEKTNQYKSVQCHECEGCGHIITECATFLKKQKKGLAVSWSDDGEANRDGESDTGKQVNVMTSRIITESEYGDDVVYHEELTGCHSKQDDNNIDMCRQLEEQKETIFHLQEERIGHLAKITKLNNEVMLLNPQLDHVLKQVRMMTTGIDVLGKMIDGQIKGKPNGIGFTHEHLKQEHENSSYAQALEYYHKGKKKKPVRTIKFVTSSRADKPTVKEQMLEHFVELHSS